MGKLAFLFAGQGAQYSGMGYSLQQLGGAPASVFALADAVRPSTSRQCFLGTAEELSQTVNTQPCVFSVNLAAAEALRERGVIPQGVAGFSLGELSALTFAQYISSHTAFKLILRRADLMHAAATTRPGGMVAVLRLEDSIVEGICEKFSRLWPANYNADGQLVVAGDTAQIPAFCEAVKAAGGVAKALAVSGAFHSPFMERAAAGFLTELNKCSIDIVEDMPVYANLTARIYNTSPWETLASQIKSPVLWKQTMQNMYADGFDTFIEVGPGKTLTGLAKRILPGVRLFNVFDAQSLGQTIEQINKC